MMKHAVYVASPSHSDNIRRAIHDLGAVPIEDRAAIGPGWDIHHELLQGMTLRLHLLTNINAVTPHLRQNPVDLLIYDERGEDAKSAEDALERIRKDVASFAELWGPDFLFPMSRAVAVLDQDKAEQEHKSQTSRAFQLGRVHVRDVLPSPKNTTVVLKWIHKLLTSNDQAEPRIGVALSGGGLEGFLYQLGVIYALERCISGKSIRHVDVYSGVSSGSIARECPDHRDHQSHAWQV